MILVEPKNENDLLVFNFKIKNMNDVYNRVESILNNNNNIYHTAYLSVKEQLWIKRRIDCPELLKVVGNNRLSTKNLNKLKTIEGTIYPYITEQDNDQNIEKLLEEVYSVIQEKNTTRLVLRNMPNLKTYISSLNNNIDVPCAVFFQYLKDRFIVNFRAHALKSEFISDFCLIFKYYFYPVYKKMESETTYQIIANTTQEIEYIKTTDFKNFINFINEPY